MQRVSIAFVFAMFAAGHADAGVILGAGAGPVLAGGPSAAGGTFAGEVGAIFPTRSSTRWGFAFEAGISVLERSEGKLGGSDLALVSRFQWRIGGVYLGTRGGVAGHFFQFKPTGGQMQAETKQFGWTIGPELSWPLSSHTELDLRLSYQATNADVDAKPDGYPPHAVDLFVGLARAL